MNKDSNKFIFGFSTAMVVVVAVLLSLAAIGLGPYQSRNVKLEKMQNILGSIGITSEASAAENEYHQYIVQQLVLNKKGQVVDSGVSAFDIDLKKEMDKERTGEGDKRLFPLFVGKKDGQTLYVIPVRGKGLWGPIWGYIAIGEDRNTVYGVSFGHKGETPGLGAEIGTGPFQEQFVRKKLLDDSGNFVSIKVKKGGATPGNPHEVDAISGATVTSTGVSNMIHETLSCYMPYFKSLDKH